MAPFEMNARAANDAVHRVDPTRAIPASTNAITSGDLYDE